MILLLSLSISSNKCSFLCPWSLGHALFWVLCFLASSNYLLEIDVFLKPFYSRSFLLSSQTSSKFHNFWIFQNSLRLLKIDTEPSRTIENNVIFSENRFLPTKISIVFINKRSWAWIWDSCWDVETGGDTQSQAHQFLFVFWKSQCWQFLQNNKHGGSNSFKSFRQTYQFKFWQSLMVNIKTIRNKKVCMDVISSQLTRRAQIQNYVKLGMA